MDLLLYPVILGAILLPSALCVRRHGLLEGVTLGAASAVVVWSCLALARFFMLLPPGWPRTAGLASLAFALGISLLVARYSRALTSRPRRSTPLPRKVFILIAAVAAVTLGLEAVLPHYGIAFFYYDWWMHFDLAQFYRAPSDFWRAYEGGSTTARTPLFDLLGGLALALLGDRFSVFQVLTAAVGWLWVLPFALLARRFVPQRQTLVIALLGLSPLILYSTTYSWPKGLVAFLVLVAVERFLALREAGSASLRLSAHLGVVTGAAVMTHAGFIGYLAPCFAILAWEGWTRRRHWRDFAVAAGMALAVILPWYAWAIAQYGWQRGLFGYPRGHYGLVAWVVDHFVILASSVLPISLPVNAITHTLDPVQNYLLVYLGTASGLLGIGFLIRALAYLTRNRHALRAPGGDPLLACAVVGMLTATVMHPGIVANTANSVFIPGLLCLSLLVLRTLPVSRPLILLAVTELLAAQTVALLSVWSPASAGQPNTWLAVTHHIAFLGRAVWPLGLAILIAGWATCILALRLRVRLPAQVVPGRAVA